MPLKKFLSDNYYQMTSTQTIHNVYIIYIVTMTVH